MSIIVVSSLTMIAGERIDELRVSLLREYDRRVCQMRHNSASRHTPSLAYVETARKKGLHVCMGIHCVQSLCECIRL